MLKRMVVFWVLFAGVSPVFAETLPSEADIRKLADKIMESAGKGDILGAFNVMKPYVVISDSELQSAALNSKSQRDQFEARFGKSIGYEFIAQKKEGASLIRLTYIEKTEKNAMPWFFYFYKTPSGWSLNSFVWNDKVPLLFQND